MFGTDQLGYYVLTQHTCQIWQGDRSHGQGTLLFAFYTVSIRTVIVPAINLAASLIAGTPYCIMIMQDVDKSCTIIISYRTPQTQPFPKENPLCRSIDVGERNFPSTLFLQVIKCSDLTCYFWMWLLKNFCHQIIKGNQKKACWCKSSSVHNFFLKV